MFHGPSAWEIEVRRELLEDEIGRLQQLPYSLWREVIGRAMVKTAKARDGRSYRIRTTATWAASGSEDIRVVVTLEAAPLHRRLMRQRFVISPENTFSE